MPDDKVSDFIKDTAKGVEYFGKIRKGRSPLMERMEDAAEGPVESAPPPNQDKSINPYDKLKKKSTGGSAPCSKADLKRGYRKS